jgi:protease-4
VDQAGGLSDAVDVACRLAGLDRSRVEVRSYPHVNPLQRLVPAQSSESPAAAQAAGPRVGAGAGLAGLGLAGGSAGLGGEGLPWVDRLLVAAGMPYGALSLPWRLTIN